MNGYTLNGDCLRNLYTRQLCPDPYNYLSTFEQSYYGLRSFVQRLKLDKTLKEHDGCVNCINFSTGGEVLVSGSDDLHVVLWNWEKGNLLAKVESGHMANVFQVSTLLTVTERQDCHQRLSSAFDLLLIFSLISDLNPNPNPTS